jgi:hypothetical protein
MSLLSVVLNFCLEELVKVSDLTFLSSSIIMLCNLQSKSPLNEQNAVLLI